MAVAWVLLLLVVVAHKSFSAELGPTTITVDFPPRQLTYKEKVNYFDLRANSKLFYWLYYEVDGQGEPVNTRPWFLWLQGGPGASGTGYGNFQELGPKDINDNTNPATWLSRADLLFVDSPVGSGYSYVTDPTGYTKDVEEIAKDLVDFTIFFVTNNPNYKTRPYYITCESYGGKVAAVYAWRLWEAVQAGRVELNFKGVGLGDSWVSPIDFVDTWPEYLYYVNRLSLEQLAQLKKSTSKCDDLVAKGLWPAATTCWSNVEAEVLTLTDGVSFYNILKQTGQDAWAALSSSDPENVDPSLTSALNFEAADDALSIFMNGPVRQRLGTTIPPTVQWGGQSNLVFARQRTDFMKPVIDAVDLLLNQTTLGVYIYNGQLDLICDTAGVERWVNKLQWPGLANYKKAKRQPVNDHFGEKSLVGYVQSYSNLYFYWILNSGHMVPHDSPTGSLTMLDMITGAP